MGRGHRWLLAFDAGCCACRSLSEVVDEACRGAIEVVPLQRPDVLALRERAFGGSAPHAPTLLSVTTAQSPQAPEPLQSPEPGVDGVVRGWTGAAMSVRLARVLGARDAVRVVRALGEARRAARDIERDVVDAAAGPTRKRFLELSAGAGVVLGAIALGRAPAAVATPADREVHAWLARNRGALPTRYDDVVAYPLAYRKAIYTELEPHQRRALWLEQLERFERQQAPLTGQQRDALAAVRRRLAHDDAVSGRQDSRTISAVSRRDAVAAEAMTAAFGLRAAGRAVAELGPVEHRPAESTAGQPATLQTIPDCNCSLSSDYCNFCTRNQCFLKQTRCGFLYNYDCDGYCPFP